MAIGERGTPDRRCPECGHAVARLNPGPRCFACTPDDFSSRGPRQRRKRLPIEEILEAYHRIGDPSQVARELDLPRSSVWYAIKRAKEQGSVSG